MPSHPLRLIALTLSTPLCPVCDSHTLPIYHPSTHNNSHPSHFGSELSSHHILSPPISPVHPCLHRKHPYPRSTHTPQHTTPVYFLHHPLPPLNVLIGPIVSPIPSRSAALTSSKQSLRVYFHPYHTTLVFDIHRILVLRSTTSPFYVEHSLSFTVFTVVTTPTNQPTTSD